jgi:hypothetical protein
MAKQMDNLFGMHWDGKSYNRWSDQQRKMKKKKEKAKSRRTVSVNQHDDDVGRDDDDDDDSFLSLLFGNGSSSNRMNAGRRRRGGGGSFSNDLYDAVHSNSLALLLRALFLFGGRVAGSVCRWGGVHGTIPRSLVGLGLVAAGLCCRGGLGVRLKNVLFALLGIRVVGEWLNGFFSVEPGTGERP